MYAGKTRRIAAGRIGWAISTGEWPRGSIKARDGNERDLRPANLIQVRHGRDPFGAISDKHAEGARASALVERQARVTALINALAANPGSTAPTAAAA